MPVMRNKQPSPPTRTTGKGKRQSAGSPTTEKKKVISRNVDRKKLSEEELEELRRRERDYQRERRARIRLEKVCVYINVIWIFLDSNFTQRIKRDSTEKKCLKK